MGLTKAQRYNRNMDKIFAKSEELGNHTLNGSTEKRAKSAALKGKMNRKDKMSYKYGGMTTSGEYIKPNTSGYAKEQRMFDSAKREINKLKRQGK